MDQRERKEDPSLPPDYVSLAQLQERWLQKQQEKKLKKKQEEEKKERDAGTQNKNQKQRGLKNDGHKKIAGGSLRDVPRRRVGKDGREIGAIEDKGKGKEIVIGGFENGEEKKKKKKKKKKKTKKKKKKQEEEEEEEERHFEKKKSAADGEKGSEVGKEKLRSEIKEFDGGDGCEGVGIVPGNEVNVGIQGVLSGESSGKGGIYGGQKGTEEIVSVSTVEVLPRCGVRGEIRDVKRIDFSGGFGRNGDNQGSDYKSKNEYRVRVDELKEIEVKSALEKKMKDKKRYGKKWRERRNGDYRDSDYRLRESRPDVLKGNAVEPESEKKAEDEILEVCSEIGGFNGRDRNGFWGQSNNGRNKTKEHKVEGEGLNNNRVAGEKKVDNEVLVVESAKNGEKGGVGNGYRRYGNWRGNIGRKYGGLTFNDWKAGNVRSRVEVNVGDGRRYARYGRFEDRWKMKQRESGMMWVKKEEKLGADAAEVGSSGISVDLE